MSAKPGQAAAVADPEDLFRVDEIAEAMRIDKMGVYRLIWSGDMVATNIAKTGARPRLRVRRRDYDEFNERRRVCRVAGVR